MTFTTEQVPVYTTYEDMEVEKFVEIIGGKMISRTAAYNYTDHDPKTPGQYHSWPVGSGKGNSIFIIPAGTIYRYDIYQDMYQSDYIQFVRWIEGTMRENFETVKNK